MLMRVGLSDAVIKQRITEILEGMMSGVTAPLSVDVEFRAVFVVKRMSIYGRN